MKIIRELQITSEEFYDFLESEFLNQMNESDNPAKYTGKLKKGLRYSKLSDNVFTKTDYEILEYRRHERYVIQISSHSEKLTTSYHTKPRMVPYRYWSGNCYCMQTLLVANSLPNSPENPKHTSLAYPPKSV